MHVVDDIEVGDELERSMGKVKARVLATPSLRGERA